MPKKNALKAVLKKTQSNLYPTHRFACSKFAGEWLFGKAAHFEVVYNAIDLDRFRFNAELARKREPTWASSQPVCHWACGTFYCPEEPCVFDRRFY